MIWRQLQILLIALAAHDASIAAAPHRESGFLDRAVTVGGVEYRYEVYVPRDYDPGRAWPIVLALHGGGEYGSDGIRPTVGALAKAIRLHPDRFPAIVVFAQAHADGTPSWQLKSGDAALVEVDETLTEFHGDSSRIYLTGYSAGGNSAWPVAVVPSEGRYRPFGAMPAALERTFLALSGYTFEPIRHPPSSLGRISAKIGRLG